MVTFEDNQNLYSNKQNVQSFKIRNYWIVEILINVFFFENGWLVNFLAWNEGRASNPRPTIQTKYKPIEISFYVSFFK